MDRLHPEVLSTLNRHQRTLVGEAFGDMVEAHQTHTQALKNSLEDVLEESSVKEAKWKEEMASLEAKLEEQRASHEAELKRQKASLAREWREEKASLNATQVASLVSLKEMLEKLRASSEKKLETQRVSFEKKLETQRVSLEAEFEAQRAKCQRQGQEPSAEAAQGAEHRKLHLLISSTAKQLHGQRRHTARLRHAQHNQLLAELKNQAALWMVAPCPVSCDDAAVPLVFSSWSLREETRKVQQNMPLLHNHLQEHYQYEEMRQHLVQHQRREAELERRRLRITKWQQERCQGLEAYWIKEDAKRQEAELKKRAELHRKLLKEADKRWIAAEKARRKNEEKARKKKEKEEKKEAKRLEREAKKLAKEKEKQKKKEAKEAARAERETAAGGRLFCCFRRRASAAN